MASISVIQAGNNNKNVRQSGTHRANTSEVRNSNSYLTYIDGLRGLSIALVVIFHIFVGKVSSGVDVFLFVGGVMLLSSQINNSANPNGTTMFQSIIRIIRRLAPALVLVTSVTIILAMFVYPPISWKNILDDSVSSITYSINWKLGLAGETYAKAGQEVSMFQHLWSMSAQMQIYVFIIFLVYAIQFIFNRKHTIEGKNRQRKITIAIVSILTVLSFIYATYEMFNNQTLNYYSPFSRFWEIGLGALIGLFFRKVALAPALRWILSIIGLVLIFSVGLFLNGAQQFPGYLTLIPIVGAAMILFSGISYGDKENRNWKRFGMVMVLETKPFQVLGKISYSLYLWHWPLLIIFVHMTGEDSRNPKVFLPVISLSLGLAWLTMKFVENPLRQRVKPERGNPFTAEYYRRIVRTDPPKGIIAASVSLVVAFAIISMSPAILKVGQDYISKVNQEKIQQAGGWDKSYPGAATTLYNVPAPSDVPIQPELSNIDSMMPLTQPDKCFTDFGNGELVLNKPDGSPCQYGDTDSNKTLYVVGGSHSEQYIPALDNIGKKRHIKIIPILKMGCALYQDIKWDNTDFPECYQDWSPKAEQYIKDNPPTEGVFMVSTRPATIQGDGPEVVPSYYVDVFRRLADAGIKIYGVRDNPWFTQNYGEEKDVRQCVSDNPHNVEQCGQEGSKTLLPTNPANTSYNIPTMVNIDLTKAFLNRDGYAEPVIGNILVYRDSHHLTSQFVKTLEPELERQMFG